MGKRNKNSQGMKDPHLLCGQGSPEEEIALLGLPASRVNQGFLALLEDQTVSAGGQRVEKKQ
jgi:hypothetical protein